MSPRCLHFVCSNFLSLDELNGILRFRRTARKYFECGFVCISVFTVHSEDRNRVHLSQHKQQLNKIFLIYKEILFDHILEELLNNFNIRQSEPPCHLDWRGSKGILSRGILEIPKCICHR